MSDPLVDSVVARVYGDEPPSQFEQGVADERERCRHALQALFKENMPEGPYLDGLRAAYSALFLSAP